MPAANGKSYPTQASYIGTGAEQDMGSGRMESHSSFYTAEDGIASNRRVSESGEQCSVIWQTRFRKDVATQCVRGCLGAGGASGLLCTVCEVGAASSGCEEGIATAAVALEAWEVPSIDYRRSRVCSAEPGGDGSALHMDRRSIRMHNHPAEQQPTVLEVGEYLQGPDDDSSCYRSLGASQRDPRAQRTELPPRASKQRAHGTERRCFIVNNENFQWGKVIVAEHQGSFSE